MLYHGNVAFPLYIALLADEPVPRLVGHAHVRKLSLECIEHLLRISRSLSNTLAVRCGIEQRRLRAILHDVLLVLMFCSSYGTRNIKSNIKLQHKITL